MIEYCFMVVIAFFLLLAPFSNAIFVEAFDKKRRFFTSLSWEVVTGTYWSNFQAHSPICVWHNRPNFITPLHGYSGSQVRLCVRGGRSFGIGIILPNRFYQALETDDNVNAFVTTLSHRLRIAKSGPMSHLSEAATYGEEKA